MKIVEEYEFEVTGVFDEMKVLKNEMKNITSDNRELRKLKIRRIENEIKQLDIDNNKISDQRNVKIQDLKMLEIRLNNELRKRWIKQRR